jgi:hypothetical protein
MSATIYLFRKTHIDICVRCAVLCKVACHAVNHLCSMIFDACHLNVYNETVSTLRTL